MSREKIALEWGEGIPTPEILPETQALGNARPFPNGYAACAAWWRDFSDRLDVAEAYSVDPKLYEAVQALPHDQLSDFCDALGEMLVSWKRSSEPEHTYTSNPARVAFCKLSPNEQDAQFDGNYEPCTDLARQMFATQPWEVEQ